MRSELVWAASLLVAVILTAAIVNAVTPAHRRRVRRVVILYVVYLLSTGALLAVDAFHLTGWAHSLSILSQLLAGFNVVNVAATLIFTVLLPRSGVLLPMIATDLAVGVGYVVAAISVLSANDVDTKSVLAGSAVASAVLAISLQSTLGNILGGIALQLDGSIHEGDWIQLENGKQGRVALVRWRHTVIETRDWSTMVVPNSQLLASTITILGKRGGKAVPQRMWVWFNVDFRYAPSRVIEVVTQALAGAQIQGVAADPPPNVVCMDFSKDGKESFATYAVRYWLTDLAADDPTSSRVRARIYTALRRAGIPIALPTRRNLLIEENEKHLSEKTRKHMTERVSALKTVHLFHTLTDDELTTLAEGLSHTVYTNGETITRQGAVAHWLYILVSGSAEVKVHHDPDGDGPMREKEVVIAKLEAPDFFGEMGLMTGEARFADVVATSDVECFRLDKATFERVLLKRPAMVGELSDKLASRRVQLIAIKEGLDDEAKSLREARERDRILKGIKSFFGLE